jgi:hypothetical protein
MKKILLITLAGLSMLVSGCSDADKKNASPAFMFWCFRDEVVTSGYHVPDMNTPERAAFLQNRLKGMPGFVNSRCELENRMLFISYQSSLVRKMNFEEGIALLGFSVNGRPASPDAQLPEGLQ